MYCFIAEIIRYQSLFTELKLSKQFSSYAQFYLGSHFPSRALAAHLGKKVNYLKVTENVQYALKLQPNVRNTLKSSYIWVKSIH